MICITIGIAAVVAALGFLARRFWIGTKDDLIIFGETHRLGRED